MRKHRGVADPNDKTVIHVAIIMFVAPFLIYFMGVFGILTWILLHIMVSKKWV